MIHMRKVVRLGLGILAIGVTICAAINVYGDDAKVRSDAEAVACPRGCTKATSVSYERSPVAETVTYMNPGGTIRVTCMRAAVLIGPYSCVRE
jgi:hypothetical protein